MAILDILKRKKEPKEKTKPEEKQEESVKKAERKRVSSKKTKKIKKSLVATTEVKPSKRRGRVTAEVYRALKIPHITEKATSLVAGNQYVFRVLSHANKVEIKKAIEGLYGVDVRAVKIIHIPSKKRRIGRTMGKKAGYKKAVIKIAEGQKIEVLPR